MKKPKSLTTTFSEYNVLKAIGQGGNGFVYEIEEDGELYAAKILEPSRVNKEKLKRFENEYRFCSRERHENIIHAHDHGLTENGAPFFVMPKFDGSIRDLIGQLNPNECFALIKHLLNGLEASHKYSVIHRDLKPENILYKDNINNIVLADFGIAEFGEEELYTAVETQDGSRLANFQYAAPEQRARGGNIDKTTDIYSLGLIIVELFTAELPLGKNHKTISSISEQYGYLDDIVEKMLQQSQNDRYQFVEEIKLDISARSNEYIASQKISELENIVIPAHEVDDEIVNDPIRIVDVSWEDGILNIHLNHHPNYQWQRALQNMGGHSSVMGKGPEMFRFNDSKAIISADDDREAQRIIDHFKQWLPKAAQVYENKLRQDAKQQEQEKINELKRKIAEEQKKKDVNEKLTF